MEGNAPQAAPDAREQAQHAWREASADAERRRARERCEEVATGACGMAHGVRAGVKTVPVLGKTHRLIWRVLRGEAEGGTCASLLRESGREGGREGGRERGREAARGKRARIRGESGAAHLHEMKTPAGGRTRSRSRSPSGCAPPAAGKGIWWSVPYRRAEKIMNQSRQG